MLSRDELLAIADGCPIAVEVPEWQTTVFVRRLSGIEREVLTNEYERAKDSGSNMKSIATLVAMATCDESGKQVFQLADVPDLLTKSASALMAIFAKAAQHNGLTIEAQEAIAKN